MKLSSFWKEAMIKMMPLFVVSSLFGALVGMIIIDFIHHGCKL